MRMKFDCDAGALQVTHFVGVTRLNMQLLRYGGNRRQAARPVAVTARRGRTRPARSRDNKECASPNASRLGRISSELGFIGQYPERAGARLFRIGENAAATPDATRFAARRMELYKGGAYRPCVYTMIWTRRDVLAWAQNYRGGP